MNKLEDKIIKAWEITIKTIDAICQSIWIDLKATLEYIKEPFLPKTAKISKRYIDKNLDKN